MTHLGDRLSALVDGELDGAEHDKATAHLARCEECRTEAAALRDLKRQIKALAADPPAGTADEADMMRRLIEMTGIGASAQSAATTSAENMPSPLGHRGLRALSHPARALRPARGLGPGGLGPARGLRPGGVPRAARRPAGAASRPGIGPRIARRPSRYLALGAVTILVGLGTAAFSVGGGDAAPGPRITPPMELYSEEHAITTGDVPFAGVPGSAEEPLPSITATSIPTQTP